jgi:glycerol uptake facilitator protein
MEAIMGEFIGTLLLLILGEGVVANVLLQKTTGNNSGWIVITIGWGIAVFVGVYSSTALGGNGHLNPAVTITQALLENITWKEAVYFIAAQFGGAILGAAIIWMTYKNHFDATDNADTKLSVFCTAPAINSPIHNLMSEAVGTFMLVFGALLIAPSDVKLGALDALPVALLVLGIGLSLGGPTGYAINPARDMGPRIAHSILPIKGKRNSNWGYAWIPVAGPVVGGLVAGFLYQALH